MPDAPHLAHTAVRLLRAAFHASREQGSHMQQAFGGWDECKPGEKANDECDGTFACDAYKAWQKSMEAGDRSRAELAVDQLVAELTEAQAKLVADGKAIDDLRDLLAERDKQIAELLAAEPTLDDDQPGVPR